MGTREQMFIQRREDGNRRRWAGRCRRGAHGSSWLTASIFIVKDGANSLDGEKAMKV